MLRDIIRDMEGDLIQYFSDKSSYSEKKKVENLTNCHEQIMAANKDLKPVFMSPFKSFIKAGEVWKHEVPLGTDPMNPDLTKKPRTIWMLMSKGLAIYFNEIIFRCRKMVCREYIQAMGKKEFTQHFVQCCQSLPYEAKDCKALWLDGSAFESTQNLDTMRQGTGAFIRGIFDGEMADMLQEKLGTANPWFDLKPGCMRKVLKAYVEQTLPEVFHLFAPIASILTKNCRPWTEEVKNEARKVDIYGEDGHRRYIHLAFRGTTPSGHYLTTEINSENSIVYAQMYILENEGVTIDNEFDYGSRRVQEALSKYVVIVSGDDMACVSSKKNIDFLKKVVDLVTISSKRPAGQEVVYHGNGQIVEESGVVDWTNIDFCSKTAIGDPTDWKSVRFYRDYTKILLDKNEYTGTNTLMKRYPCLHG